MNNLLAIEEKVAPARAANLLDTIRQTRAEVGDGLNDNEFTRLLVQKNLPAEAGFTFLSYCDRYVTFAVPPQKTSEWYRDLGWMSPHKEKIAAAIAEKCALKVCEPPDTANSCCELPNPHHHMELSHRQETIIFIHPQFLKIRLFVMTSATRTTHGAQRPFQLCPNLLHDLAALYPA